MFYMNDFISMMGWRETTIQKIIYDVRCGCEVEEACSRNGLPWRDLLSSEQARILSSAR